MTLEQYFKEHPKAAIAVSGGTDSAFLLYMAKTYGKEVSAWYFMTPFQHQQESEDTRRICRELGILLHVVKDNVLNRTEIVTNDELRCYYCKKYMFSKLLEAVAEQMEGDGWELMEGTNASDQPEGRPGYRALKELGILSPLRACGLTKAQIRQNRKSWDCLLRGSRPIPVWPPGSRRGYRSHFHCCSGWNSVRRCFGGWEARIFGYRS